jgi:ABC-type multidrug transport system ATPase subunit
MNPSTHRLNAVAVAGELEPAGVAERAPSVPASVIGPRLALQQITKQWDKRKAPVLDGIDLNLQAGQVVVLWGQNGAGKTTLLRIAAGLIGADNGTVRLDGLSPTRDRREYYRRLGFLSAASAGLYARLTVDFHLDFAARVSFLPRGRRKAAIAAAVARFELEDLRSQRVDRISMGQRQRVRLALTFLHGPGVLLLDEPRNSLDDNGVRLLTQALEEHREAGGTAIWCAPTGEGIDMDFDAVYQLAGGKMERV